MRNRRLTENLVCIESLVPEVDVLDGGVKAAGGIGMGHVDRAFLDPEAISIGDP